MQNLFLMMQTILDDFRKGVTDISFPEKIKSSVHAQVFYGVISAILEDKKITTHCKVRGYAVLWS